MGVLEQSGGGINGHQAEPVKSMPFAKAAYAIHVGARKVRASRQMIVIMRVEGR